MVTVYRVLLHAAVSQLCDAPLTSIRISLEKASVWHGGISDRRSWNDRGHLYAVMHTVAGTTSNLVATSHKGPVSATRHWPPCGGERSHKLGGTRCRAVAGTGLRSWLAHRQKSDGLMIDTVLPDRPIHLPLNPS